MKIFYFTATGNSLAVAKKIGGELISIPQIMNEESLEFKDDAIGFVFPTWGLTAPKVVRDFLQKGKFDTNYMFAIGTYGNIGDAVVQNLQKEVSKVGVYFDYTNAIEMVDNYVGSFDIEKQIRAIPKKKIDEHIDGIVKDIQARKRFEYKSNPLIVAASVLVKPLIKKQEKGLMALDYKVEGKCVQCGICTKVCPTGNITVKEKPEFSDHCYACYACIHACPQKVIHLKREAGTARWKNPDVTLNEIIDSNCQIEK